MDFLPREINAYVESKTQAESAVLAELNRQTHLKVLYPRMLSGHLQGRVLSFFAKMMQPQRILEIGTYTGYATLCLAEGLGEGGKIITIEKDEELSDMILHYAEKAGIAAKVDLRIGDAKEILPTLAEVFDIVFLDADKQHYLQYYELVLPMLRQGGVILADNVLWSGKIALPAAPNDKETLGLQAFNDAVSIDSRVECVLLPIRDGIMMIRKK